MKKSFYYSIILSGCLVISGVVSAAVLGWVTPSGHGVSSWSTTNPGARNFTVIDEALCNGNNDYVFTNTLLKRDSYKVSLAAIPNGSIINKIEILPCASSNKNDTPTSTPTFITMFYKTGLPTTTFGIPTLLPTSTIPVVLSTTTFDGLNLLKNAQLANLEVGAMYSQGNRGVRMSQVQVRITY